MRNLCVIIFHFEFIAKGKMCISKLYVDEVALTMMNHAIIKCIKGSDVHYNSTMLLMSFEMRFE